MLGKEGGWGLRQEYVRQASLEEALCLRRVGGEGGAYVGAGVSVVLFAPEVKTLIGLSRVPLEGPLRERRCPDGRFGHYGVLGGADLQSWCLRRKARLCRESADHTGSARRASPVRTSGSGWAGGFSSSFLVSPCLSGCGSHLVRGASYLRSGRIQQNGILSGPCLRRRRAAFAGAVCPCHLVG